MLVLQFFVLFWKSMFYSYKHAYLDLKVTFLFKDMSLSFFLIEN